MKLSNRILSLQESPIRKLVPIANKAKASGKKVYHLNIGQPDIETPSVFMEKIKSFGSNVIAYSFSKGDPELINAIIKYYQNFDINYSEDEVLITNGGSEAICFAMMAICDVGDEILIPEPFYTNYNSFSTVAGVKIVPITTSANEGFHLPDVKKIEASITSKTKAIMISNPGNPTGVVYTDEELKMLVDLAIKHNLYIISDEVYREFTYDGLKYTSMGNFKEIEDRVVIIDSVSKRFSTCGARIGCITSKNKLLIENVLKLCQGRLCVPTLEQVGATALYQLPNSYIEEVKAEYDKRRNIIYDTLQSIDGLICKKPTGAFYVIAKLPIDNAEEFVIWMLEEFEYQNQTVMLAPAEGFYATPGLGKDEVRIAYVLHEEELVKAMQVLKIALTEYINK